MKAEDFEKLFRKIISDPINKGIFRIWIIVIPITWIVLYINSGIYYPNNSCDGREVERCSCIYTLEDKQITAGWGACDFGSNEYGMCIYFKQYKKFKDPKSCINFFKNAKKNTICSKDQSLVKSCESKKKDKQKEFIINMILLIIFPLTFYPIYLGLRRTFIWIKEGFKK